VKELSEHPIEGLMKTTMDNLKEMIDVNTIVGDPVQSPDGLVIIPVSKVSFGFASGGSEFNFAPFNKNISEIEADKHPFGGGSGAGVSLQPVGFIVVGNEQIKLMPVDEGNNALSSFFDFMNSMSNNVQNMINNKKDNETTIKVKNNSYDDENE